MKLANTKGLETDTIPYRILSAAGTPVRVRFSLLEPDDNATLTAIPWSNAVFAASWPAYIGNADARKLVLVEQPNSLIYGMVCLGKLAALRSQRSLQYSLLETAPDLRRSPVSSPSRPYNGVGRVLVARLIVESYNQGGGGRVAVKPRPGTEQFYQHLGFRNIMPGPFFLSEQMAELLFENATE